MGTRRHTIGLLALGLALGGCRGDASSARVDEREAPAEPTELVEEPPGRPSWGPRVPASTPEPALAAELARRATNPELRALTDDDGQPEGLRERGLWSLARIGGSDARERLVVELDGGRSLALAATALLEVPRSEAGSPPEPLEGGAWGMLEDALWTRYAVTDPAEIGQLRALLLAIARLGGSRSVARFGVDLAEIPGADHGPAVVARWSSAMRALGLMCARGHGLDEATAEAVAGGLADRSGVDPEVSLAALYALSRCARSSGELLVESRELLVGRLTPHVQSSIDPRHAALAWRAFAGLGELPEDVPIEIAGLDPPPWTVEVEAVRAIGSDPRGAAILRERLLVLSGQAFDGPRQHVLLAALQAMRADIGAAPSEVDGQLAALATELLITRHAESPRLRKLAALGLCELRLLQAIRSGETSELARCHETEGAPAVELPQSLLVNLEVEALLRATRDDPEQTRDTLATGTIDDEAVIADRVEDPQQAGDPDRRARIGRLLELARSRDPARATPALHALAEIDDPGVPPVLRAALASDDPGVLAAAATAEAVRSVDASKRDLEAVPLLETLVADNTGAAELEARLAAIEALGVLARTAVASVDPNPGGPLPEQTPEAEWLARTIVPLAVDPNVAVRTRAREALLGREQLLIAFDRAERNAAVTRPSPFPERVAANVKAFLDDPPAGLRVTTSAGSFTIEFAGVASPINQANLVALAREGFYDGLSFHRIVPGFVVQGGDPRGDGYGGPGYVVPCEWSNLRYERGTVGIALAGKDTGGSQLFVTQTPQPHLDARYTVIGQVGEGLDVVDLLLPGDRIERVEVVYAAARSDGSR